MTTQGGRDLPYDGEPGRAIRRVVKPVFRREIVATVRAAAGKGFNPFSNPFRTPLQTPFKTPSNIRSTAAGGRRGYSPARYRPPESLRGRQGGNAIRQRGSPIGRGVCAANSQGCRRIDDHVKTANYCRSLRAREHRENRQRRKAAWAPLPTFLQKSRSLPF